LQVSLLIIGNIININIPIYHALLAKSWPSRQLVSVASEKLFLLAKRTVNSNRASLSETNAENIVRASSWMKDLKEVS
jgi:hypothetical protein